MAKEVLQASGVHALASQGVAGRVSELWTWTGAVQQVSIETAQSKLDCSVLEKLPGKTIILGTLDLSDMAVEKPETVAACIRRALPHVPAQQIVVAPDCGLKYLPRV